MWGLFPLSFGKARRKQIRKKEMRSHCQAEEQGAFNTIKVVRILLQRGSHLDLLLTSLSEAGTPSPGRQVLFFFQVLWKLQSVVLSPPPPHPASPWAADAFRSHQRADPESHAPASASAVWESSLFDGGRYVWPVILSGIYLVGARNGSNIFMI